MIHKVGEERLSCCSNLMKSFILLVDGLLALFGIAIIGVGVLLQQWNLSELTGDAFSYLALCFGVLVLFIGLFGFLSALNHWACGLKMFSILQLIIICSEVGLFLYCFSNQVTTEKFLKARWQGLDEESKESFQKQFSCCGWDVSMKGNSCPAGVASDEYCWQFIKDTVDDEIRFVVYFVSGIVILEIIMLVFTISVRYELIVMRAFEAGLMAEMYNPQMHNV